VAPPEGLYFMQVDYPDVILPRKERAETTSDGDDLS
jgi:tRNA pseudouridine38-40 synthase